MNEFQAKEEPLYPKRQSSQYSNQSRQGRRRKRSQEIQSQDNQSSSSLLDMKEQLCQKIEEQSNQTAKEQYLQSFTSVKAQSQSYFFQNSMASTHSTRESTIQQKRKKRIRLKNQQNTKNNQRTLIPYLQLRQTFNEDLIQVQEQYQLKNFSQSIVKLYKQGGINNQSITRCIQNLCQDYLQNNQYFTKVMIQIFFNLINYESFQKEETDNIYFMMNNSLKNSNILRILYLKYLSQQNKELKNSKVFLILTNKSIKYEEFYGIISQQLSSLDEDFERQRPKHGKIQFVEQLFKNICSNQYSRNLEAKLHNTIRIQKDMQKSSAIVTKLIIINSLKIIFLQSFRSEELGIATLKRNLFAQDKINTILLAHYSKIRQFQLCFRHRSSNQQSLLFLRQKNRAFFTEGGPKYKVSYLLQILIFIKQCLKYGLGATLNDQNLRIRNGRFAYRITERIMVAKTSYQLQSVNEQLSKLMQMNKINTEQERQFKFSQLEQYYRVFSNNFQYLRSFYFTFIREPSSSSQQYSKQIPILSEFIIQDTIYQQQKPQIIEKIQQLIKLSRQYGCQYTTEVDSSKTKNELLEIYFNLKIELIIRKIYVRYFCNCQIPINIRIYNQYITQISNVDEPLKVIYNNLFLSEPGSEGQKINNLKQKKGWRPNLQRQSLQHLKQVALKFQNINQKEIFSGILGIKTIQEKTKNMVEIVEQSTNNKSTISFRELKAQEGRQLLFKKMFPKKESLKLQRQKRPIQQLDPIITQIAQLFINNTLKAFQNLGAVNVYSPLILMRHFILHKYAENDERTIILPQINVWSSLIQKNLENPIRPKTFTIQYNINAIIQRLSLPIINHNKLICNIFLRFLTSSLTEAQYLQSVYTFLSQFDNKKTNKINSDFNRYFQKKSLNGGLIFQKNHYKKVIIITSQLLNTTHELDQNFSQVSNKISTIITEKFNKKYSLFNYHKYSKSNCYLYSTLNQSISCFIQVKYQNDKEIFQKEFNVKDYKDHTSNIFRTHALNMLYLYRKYCQQSAETHTKKINHLELVCEQDIQNKPKQRVNHQFLNHHRTSKSNSQVSSYVPDRTYQEVQQEFKTEDRSQFTVRFKLEDYLVQFCYQQMQQEDQDNEYYHKIRRQKHQFFDSNKEQDKITILKGFIQLLSQSSSLGLQVWNYNIRTVQLSTIRHQQKVYDSEDIFYLSKHDQIFLKPTFSCWSCHRNFTPDLTDRNFQNYNNFYSFLNKNNLYGKQQYYFQKAYNCINIPPYHNRSIGGPTENNFKNYSQGYDVGCMGYTIALIIFKSEDDKLKFHFIQKILLDYHSHSKSQSIKTISEAIDQQFKIYKKCNLIEFIKKMIRPDVQKRICIQNLIRESNSGIFHQIDQINKRDP